MARGHFQERKQESNTGQSKSEKAGGGASATEVED